MSSIQNCPNSGANFSSVPILDYSLIDSPTTRPQFIHQLQHSLINVGFLYLKNHSVDNHIIDSLISYIPQLFALPQEEKDKIRMANSEHFLGYSRIGMELTKGKVDQREQFDLATPHVSRWREGEMPKELEYLRLWGPSQVSFPVVCFRPF
jgi:isopenicillin N synthase-like dioxygenase